MASPKPEVKALLLCDHVIHEQGSNKKSLIGIFNQVHSAQFPFKYGRISVYANLADAHGSYDLSLRLVRLRDGKNIVDIQGIRMQVADPLAISELGINLDGIVFEEPGKYEFALYANDQFLQSKPFRAVKYEPTARGGPGGGPPGPGSAGGPPPSGPGAPPPADG